MLMTKIRMDKNISAKSNSADTDQDIWKIEKKTIAFGQGLFTLTEMAKTT